MTINDLFTSHLTKKEQLLLWIKEKEFVTTAQVDAWGLENYHIRARRDAQDMAVEGRIKRLDEKEKLFRWFTGKQGVWQFVK